LSGIAALVAHHRDVDAAEFNKWVGCLEVVGPDGMATWNGDRVGLAHAALDVYPTDKGGRVATLDGSVRIVADARLDAVGELRAALRAAGRNVPDDASDAQLLLHAYHAWGESFLDHLIGDFAFILWDDRQKRLLAAVDHFGVRPIYYANSHRGVALSNWGATLYRHRDVDRTPDDHAIVSFLRNGFMPAGATAFTGIRVLPAAHRLIVHGDEVRVDRYWNMPIEPPLERASAAEYQSEFLALLSAAIEDRSRGRPVSVLLSGGLDSTGIAAVARRLTSVGANVSGHTVVFRSRIPDDEQRYAAAVARHLGIDITYHPQDGYAPYDRGPEVATLTPVIDHSPFASAMFEIFSPTPRERRIAFTGHGTDVILAPEWLRELLKGPWRARAFSLVPEAMEFLLRYRRRPSLGLRYAATAPHAGGIAPPPPPEWLNERWRSVDVSANDPHVLHHPHRSRAYTRTVSRTLPHAVGSFTPFARRALITCTHPYIDLRVVRYCLRVPPIPWCWDKHLLRESFRDLLPAAVLARPKTALRRDPLASALLREGFGFLSGLEPGPLTSRYYAPPSFRPLRELMLRDPWQNGRPIALEFFSRGWQELLPEIRSGSPRLTRT
jgi:asparagine synthase (glutamine-hydrolysing)